MPCWAARRSRCVLPTASATSPPAAALPCTCAWQWHRLVSNSKGRDDMRVAVRCDRVTDLVQLCDLPVVCLLRAKVAASTGCSIHAQIVQDRSRRHA